MFSEYLIEETNQGSVNYIVHSLTYGIVGNQE